MLGVRVGSDVKVFVAVSVGNGVAVTVAVGTDVTVCVGGDSELIAVSVGRAVG